MKRWAKQILKVTVVAVFLLFLIPYAYSYNIDGDVSDWGIDLSLAEYMFYLDTHTPSGVNVDYVTEDNTDIHHGWVEVGPGWSYKNKYDVEAIYFDNDSTYLYIAIITGFPEAGLRSNDWNNPHFEAGDIAIDIDNDGVYEYAVDTSNNDSNNRGNDAFSKGHLYRVSEWYDVYYHSYPYDFSEADPFAIAQGEDKGSVDFAYSSNPINGHYVIEVAIPLVSLNLSYQDQLKIHWTMECGNDYLTLEADVDSPSGGGPVVPEPTTLALAAVGFIGFILKKGGKVC